MSSEGVGFIYEEQIQKNRYIHIPEEVHNIFIKEQIGDDNDNQISRNKNDKGDILYHWCYDDEANLILLTPFQLRDLNSEWHEHTEWNPEGQRVVFPKKAAEAIDVSVGDLVFFVAREDVQSLPVPTVYVFNMKKAENIMLQQDDEVINVLDRQPNFL